MRSTLPVDVGYSDAYKDEIFHFWYRNSRPNMVDLLKTIPPDERGRKPVRNVLLQWKSLHNWDMWADSLDAKINDQLDATVIEERVEMYKAHAEMGKNLSDMGMKYLQEGKGIESDSSAIRAIVEGIEIESKNRGLADALSKVFSMSEKELDGELKKMLTSKSGDDSGIIDIQAGDVEEPDDEETIPE